MKKLTVVTRVTKVREKGMGEECILKLVGKEKIYAFGEKTPRRKSLNGASKDD